MKDKASSSANVSRRRFLMKSAVAAGAAVLPHSFYTLAQDAVQDVPHSNNGVGYEKISWKIEPFPMQNVRLRSGPMLNAQEINLRYLNLLPNDRLLYNFRVNTGLPTSAQPLGGWENPKCELRGHFTGGHYLSACALMYGSTGDEALRRKANNMVAELAKCQAANGYLSAFPEEFFVRLRNRQKVWAPFYTYHKIMAGHLDMYIHCGNTQALQTAEKMAGWTAQYLKPIDEPQWEKMQLTEYGGMNEVLYNLYAVTGKEEYLALGKRFDDKQFFAPLAARQDDLPRHHANTNIPKIIGAARAYELTGEQRYRDIADYFWEEVVTEHAYATGGTSNGEYWQQPGKLADQLGSAAEECCCSYNMLKLTRHLHGWTGNPRYMDYYERVLYNARLGTQDPNGMLMYYLPLKPGLWKTFGTPFHSFWCCTGTGVEEYSKTNNTVYSHDDSGLYVNLFVGSEVNWPQKRIRVIQDTNFPEQEGTLLRIAASHPVHMPLHVRIPYWATENVAVTINGKPQHHIAATPTSYVTINRHWKDGDKVEISLPMHLHTSQIPDDHTLQAAMYGPLVLAAQLGTQGLSHEMIYGDSGPHTDRLKPPIPEVNTAEDRASAWIQRVDANNLKFQTIQQTENISAIPLYKLFNERYSVYWKVNTKNS